MNAPHILDKLNDRQRAELLDVMMRDIDTIVDANANTAYYAMMNGFSANRPVIANETPDAFIERIKREQQHRDAVRECESRIAVDRLFNREQLFRFAYVPFVIAELVWDYADTVIIMASRLNQPETLKLSREIRKARADYNRLRHNYIDAEHREREIENGYVFEDAIKRITQQMMLNVRLDIIAEYPDLNDESRELLESVYQCLIMSRALLRYLDRQTDMIQRRVKHRIGKMLPPSYYVMHTLIPEFIGDKPASARFTALMKQYVDTLATQMALVELNDITDNQHESVK